MTARICAARRRVDIMKPEFAPQYTAKERWRRLTVHGLLCLLMGAVLYGWA